MPVFELPQEIAFPDPELAEDDGLLAVGGDLAPARLLAAYSIGIFPWPHEGWPLLWFSPDPRMVLYPTELKVSRSLRQSIRKGLYEVRYDTDFEGVMRGCGRARRRGQKGTWITEEMVRAYSELHQLGFAHSVEAWHEGELAGGLYGLSLGGAFFGESMFARRGDASKVAFVHLVERLKGWDFAFVDAQVHTPHLERFGAREVPRHVYLRQLHEALEMPTRKGTWRD
jgi:leucyl/phenylalanyl-tRNA---protein transferase